MNDKLLTRNAFKSRVLSRDENSCVCCKSTENLVAHHIMERKLFDDGGYYEKNGATLCPECHIRAEAGFILTCKLWELIGVDINTCIYPSCLKKDTIYDKWGQEMVLGKDDGSYIVIPNRFREEFEKAVRMAGGSVREISPEWLLEYEGIIRDKNCLYVCRLRALNFEKVEGRY